MALHTNKGISRRIVPKQNSGYTLLPTNCKIAATENPRSCILPNHILSYPLPESTFLNNSPPCPPTRISRRPLRYQDILVSRPKGKSMNIFLQGVDCYSNRYHWCPTVFISCNNTVIPNDNLLVEFKTGRCSKLVSNQRKSDWL